MGKGFQGVPGNMQQLVKQAQDLQKKMKQAAEDAEGKEFEESVGGGAVVVRMNGKFEVVSVKISADAAGDVGALEELVGLAFGGAIRKVRDATKGALENVTGGLNIPGLF